MTESKIRFKSTFVEVELWQVMPTIRDLEARGWWLMEENFDHPLQDDQSYTVHILFFTKPYVCKNLNTSTKTRRGDNYHLKGTQW